MSVANVRSDGRDWARRILGKAERGERVPSIAAEYALEAIRGYPQRPRAARDSAEVIPLPVRGRE